MRINKKLQHGYTLVEFLIAGVLGLVLLAGVGQLFLGSSQTFRAQRNLANIQDSGRFALWFLKSDLELGAWRVAPNSSSQAFVVDATVDSWIGAGQCPADICSENGAGDASDAITIALYGGADCNGSVTPVDPSVEADPDYPGSNQVVRNRYFVQNNQLMCQGNATAAAQPLIDNVDAFQVLYGVSLDTPPVNALGKQCWDRSADQYVTNPNIDLVNGVIVSVRFSLLIRGDPSRDVIASARDYVVGEQTYNFNDNIPRRVFNLTVPIRNSGSISMVGKSAQFDNVERDCG